MEHEIKVRVVRGFNDTGWVEKYPCRSLLVLLTNDGIFVSVHQVTDGDKVTLQDWNIGAVFAGDDAGLSIESHLVVILHRCVLLVGDLQGALGDVVDLTPYRWMSHVLFRDVGSITPD